MTTSVPLTPSNPECLKLGYWAVPSVFLNTRRLKKVSKECLETSKKVPRGFVISNSTGTVKKGHKNVKNLVLQNDLKNNLPYSKLCKNVPAIFLDGTNCQRTRKASKILQSLFEIMVLKRPKLNIEHLEGLKKNI